MLNAILPLLLALGAGSPAPAPTPTAAARADAAAPAAASVGTPSLHGLAAFLFDPRSGALGKDDVAIEPRARHIPPALVEPAPGSPAAPLRNVAFVTVSVTGLAAATRAPTLTFTAASKGKVLAKTSIRLPHGAAAGAPGDLLAFPFLVHETGCATVRLTAVLRPAGKGATARLERVIPFQCE